MKPFRRPGLAQAEEGLLHVMGVLRERDEVREGFDESTRRLRHLLRLEGLPRIRGVIELLRAEGRPKIGMFQPEPTTGGMANS